MEWKNSPSHPFSSRSESQLHDLSVSIIIGGILQAWSRLIRLFWGSISPSTFSQSGALANPLASNFVVVKTQPARVARSYLDMTENLGSMLPAISACSMSVKGNG